MNIAGDSPFRQNLAARQAARAEHRGVSQQIADLERFIVSVPAVIERRRSKFRDLLPPIDGGEGGSGRLSRQEVRSRRWGRARVFLTFTLLAGMLLAFVALIYFLMSTRA